MSTYPDLQLPSPRASMLGGHDDSLLHELGDPNGMHPRLHVQEHPLSLDVTSKTPTVGQRFKVPYQVTPSRESGPSQAERRLEALTLELEKELEMHMKKEYFGRCLLVCCACLGFGNLATYA